MAVIETSSERLHLQFRDEPGSQLLLGLVFTLGITAFAFLERTSCGCLADRAAGRFTIFRVNGLGLTLRISCNQGDIRTIEVRRRVFRAGPTLQCQCDSQEWPAVAVAVLQVVRRAATDREPAGELSGYLDVGSRACGRHWSPARPLDGYHGFKQVVHGA